MFMHRLYPRFESEVRKLLWSGNFCLFQRKAYRFPSALFRSPEETYIPSQGIWCSSTVAKYSRILSLASSGSA